MSAPLNLTDLEKQAARWPSSWKPNVGDDGEWCGSFDGIDLHGEAHEIETGPDTDYSVALGKFIADAVNALPVLLEVAKASVRMRAAALAAAMARVSARMNGDQAGLAESALEERMAADAYDAALAKVMP